MTAPTACHWLGQSKMTARRFVKWVIQPPMASEVAATKYGQPEGAIEEGSNR